LVKTIENKVLYQVLWKGPLYRPILAIDFAKHGDIAVHTTKTIDFPAVTLSFAMRSSGVRTP